MFMQVIIRFIENKLLNQEFLNKNIKFIPKYNGFKGKIENQEEDYKKFNIYGNLNMIKKKIN